MAKFWNWCKANLFKFVGSLIMDDKNGIQVLSLGRVLLGITFVVMMVNWHKQNPTLPDGLMAAFYTLCGYVFSSKAVQTVQSWIGTKPNGKTSEEPPPGP